MEYHPVVGKIRTHLDAAGVAYKTFEHDAVRTSEEAAAVRPEYSLAQGAKALIVRIKKKNLPKEAEKQFVQIVVPGDAKFDPRKVREALDAKDIRFATEEEVNTITGGVQPGGVPPFGNLFGLSVIADPSIFSHDEIVFNAGDRRFSIALSAAEYRRVVDPIVREVV